MTRSSNHCWDESKRRRETLKRWWSRLYTLRGVWTSLLPSHAARACIYASITSRTRRDARGRPGLEKDSLRRERGRGRGRDRSPGRLLDVRYAARCPPRACTELVQATSWTCSFPWPRPILRILKVRAWSERRRVDDLTTRSGPPTPRVRVCHVRCGRGRAGRDGQHGPERVSRQGHQGQYRDKHKDRLPARRQPRRSVLRSFSTALAVWADGCTPTVWETEEWQKTYGNKDKSKIQADELEPEPEPERAQDEEAMEE